MPTKQLLTDKIENLQAENKNLLMVLLEIRSATYWDAKQIRAYVNESLSRSFTQEPQPEKPKRTRKVSMPELAI